MYMCSCFVALEKNIIIIILIFMNNYTKIHEQCENNNGY